MTATTLSRTARPVLKPSQVLRLTNAGKLPEQIKGGRYQCLHCNYVDLVAGTESPAFHENGMYHGCKGCRRNTVHRAIFPPCAGYPEGFEIDMTGERKKYPVAAKEGRDA